MRAKRAEQPEAARRASIRSPCCRTAAGDSITTAAESSWRATFRNISGVTFLARRDRPPGRAVGASERSASMATARGRRAPGGRSPTPAPSGLLQKTSDVGYRTVDFANAWRERSSNRPADGQLHLFAASSVRTAPSANPASWPGPWIARDNGDCDMCKRSAARPKCNSSATATKYHNCRISIDGLHNTDTAPVRLPTERRGRVTRQ